jgi:hypothetical protein
VVSLDFEQDNTIVFVQYLLYRDGLPDCGVFLFGVVGKLGWKIFLVDFVVTVFTRGNSMRGDGLTWVLEHTVEEVPPLRCLPQ